MTKEQSGRQVLLVEAREITYDMGRQTEHVRKFFSELLGALDPTLSEKESKPMFFPYKSGDQGLETMRHEWFRKADMPQAVNGLDHIFLQVWPFGSLVILEILWSMPFSPAFCLGLIEDYFHTQDLHAHSLVLQADLAVQQAPSPSPPAVVPVG